MCTVHHPLITEKVVTLSKVLPLVIPLHEDVRQVVLRDLRAPDADGVTCGLHLLAALLQGPQLLSKVTRSVLENLFYFGHKMEVQILDV